MENDATMQEPEFTIVIPLEDEPLHTQINPFCYNNGCSCHEDAALIADVATALTNGLLTQDEATDFVAGKMM